jgi:hypothetical protein
MEIENILNILFTILFIISTCILYIKQETYDSFQTKNIENNKYLNPTEFKVGDIKMDTYKSANLCNSKVLYPIKNLNVDYSK